MCALCGIWGSEAHWSTGAASSKASTDSAVRRRERHERVSAINRVLRKRHITLQDWQGECYLLSSPTGKTALVDNISELWKVMDEEFGGAFDPLDPKGYL